MSYAELDRRELQAILTEVGFRLSGENDKGEPDLKEYVYQAYELALRHSQEKYVGKQVYAGISVANLYEKMRMYERIIKKMLESEKKSSADIKEALNTINIHMIGTSKIDGHMSLTMLVDRIKLLQAKGFFNNPEVFKLLKGEL